MVHVLKNGLKCVLLNARSIIVNKILQLHSLLHCDQPDFIAITESHLGPDILDTKIADTSYSLQRRDRNRQGGGVIIITRNNLLVTRRFDLEVDLTELLWVEISLCNKLILVGVFTDPLTDLALSLDKVSSSNNVVLCGDFNTPYRDWSTTSPTSSHKPSEKLCELS